MGSRRRPEADASRWRWGWWWRTWWSASRRPRWRSRRPAASRWPRWRWRPWRPAPRRTLDKVVPGTAQVSDSVDGFVVHVLAARAFRIPVPDAVDPADSGVARGAQHLRVVVGKQAARGVVPKPRQRRGPELRVLLRRAEIV